MPPFSWVRGIAMPATSNDADQSGGPQGKRRVHRFWRDRSGTVGITFGLLVIPLTAFIGLAIDFGKVYSVNSHTQAALDAAALAAGRVAQVETSDIINKASAAATAYFNQGKPTNVVTSSIEFSPNAQNTQFTVTATSWVRTPFLGVLNSLYHQGSQAAAPAGCQGNFYGCIKLKTTATAEIKVGGNGGSNVEVSLILDLTGSMCAGGSQPCSSSSKLDPLKVAAKDLIDIVVWDDQSQNTSKIALVPYSQAVNVGNYAASIRGTIAAGTSTTPGSQNFRFTNAQGNTKTHAISTCVTERTGTQKYTDAAPTAELLGRNYPGPTNGCISVQIVPLSNNKTALKTGIDGLKAAGSTGGHIGVAWGWYMLSPNFGYLWPSGSQPGSYGDTTAVNSQGYPKLRKIAVLMTDGEYNSAYCKGVISKNSISGSGSTAEQINCNAPNGGSFSQAQSQCTGMKAAGVEVFTVGFDIVNDQRAHDLVNNCATNSSHVYLATTGDALKAAFRDIALKISTLRLTN